MVEIFNTFKEMTVVLIVITVIYLISKIYLSIHHARGYNNRNDNETVVVEITNPTLKLEYNTLSEEHEIYAMQMEQYSKKIKRLEDELEHEKSSPIKDDIIIEELVHEILSYKEVIIKMEQKQIKIAEKLKQIGIKQMQIDIMQA